MTRLAESNWLTEALTDAELYLTNAIEESGDSEEVLIAEDAGTVFVRVIAARDLLCEVLLRLPDSNGRKRRQGDA